MHWDPSPRKSFFLQLLLAFNPLCIETHYLGFLETSEIFTFNPLCIETCCLASRMALWRKYFNPLCIETSVISLITKRELSFQSSLHWDWGGWCGEWRPVLWFQSSLHWDVMITAIATWTDVKDFNPLCIETVSYYVSAENEIYHFNPLCIETGGGVDVLHRAVRQFQSSLHWDSKYANSRSPRTPKISILFALRLEASKLRLRRMAQEFQSSLHWDTMAGKRGKKLANRKFQSSLHWDKWAKVWYFILWFSFQSSLHWDKFLVLNYSVITYLFQSSLHWDREGG